MPFTAELKSAAIAFYGHFGDVESAEMLFDSIPRGRADVVSIGSWMKAQTQNGRIEAALALYDEHSVIHNDVLHLQAVHCCILCGDFQRGQDIHRRLRESESINNIKIQTAMIDFYGHFGDLQTAQCIFDGIDSKQLNEVAINSMMTALIKNGRARDALRLYNEGGAASTRSRSGSRCDDVSDLLALKACSETNGHEEGLAILRKYRPIHCPMSLELKCAAIDFYGRFGDIDSAKALFMEIGDDERDSMVIGSMMNALSHNGHHKEAAALHDEHEHLQNDVTQSLAIRSCIEGDDVAAAMSRYHGRGDLVNDTSHILALRASMHTLDGGQFEDLSHRIRQSTNRSVELDNVLIDCYGRFGDVESAQSVFDGMGESKRNSVTLNSLMTVLVDRGMTSIALDLYGEYEHLHDERSHVLALCACTDLAAFDRGRAIHRKVEGRYPGNVHLQSALIDLYGNAGDIETAMAVFHSIDPSALNIVCFNSMMESLCKNGLNEECVALFNDIGTMNGELVQLVPDEISYAILLTACTQGLFLETARDVHAQLSRANEEGSSSILKAQSVGVHLIAMYGKFGMMHEAEAVFSGQSARDLYLYNAMIDGYGRNGDIEAAKKMYYAIGSELGSAANLSTFVVVLGACSHCGDSGFAATVYEEEIGDDSIKYDDYVVTNVIDCYSRTGLLDEARQIISKYEQFTGKESTEIMWTALLSGCKKHGDKGRAEEVHREMCRRFKGVGRSDSAASVLMSNLK